jgi:predicted kinase
MAKVILVCGKICSGKTTYAKALKAETRAVVLSADEIVLSLFGEFLGDEHDAVVEKSKQYLLNLAAEIARAGADVILDFGFWTRAERRAVREFFAEKSVAAQWHYLNIPQDKWRRNVARRNSEYKPGGGSYYVDETLAAKCEALFEPPERPEIDVWVEA